jgi:hypothetical protein
LLAWPIAGNDQDILTSGLDQVFIKSKVLGERAINSQEDRHFHRWRKRVKYWLYVLSGIVKEREPSKYKHQLKLLSESLGCFQDLCVLEAILLDSQIQRDHGDEIKPILKLISNDKHALKKTFKKAQKVLFKLSYRKRRKMVGQLNAEWFIQA